MASSKHADGRWTGESYPLLPFESPESALLKFAWANAITMRNAASVFQAALAGRIEPSRLNLPLNWAAWIEAYRDTTDVFSRRLVCACLGGDDWLLFETRVLRFCPICLGAGYHTWWHQCHLHTQCLIHGCRICDCCVVCGTPVALKHGGRLSLREPYICATCFNPVAGIDATWEGMDDLQAVRPVLAARYVPWSVWLNRIAESRNGWARTRDSWYAEVGDPRLIRRRSDRERLAILLLCPPPHAATTNMINTVLVEHIALWSDFLEVSSIGWAASYDPAEVIADFLLEVQKGFDASDLEQFQYCKNNMPNGFRYHCGHLRAEPLALWIVLLYTSFCAGFRRRSDHANDAVEWVEDMVRGVAQVCRWVDAEGLRKILKALYCEIIDWLSPRSVRECFDLDVATLSVTPGVSIYLWPRGDGDGDATLMMLIRPAMPLLEATPFHLTQCGQGGWLETDVCLRQDRDCRSNACWNPKGTCVRDSAGYRRISYVERHCSGALAAAVLLPLGQ